jgi:putative membrane protein
VAGGVTLMAVQSLAQADVGFSDIVQFHAHLDVLGAAAALLIGYFYGLRVLAERYAPRGEVAVTNRQKALFVSGVATIVIVSSWPIHDIGKQSLFMFHMVEHLGLALVAPPLLLAGTPWWLLRALLRPVLPVVKLLTKPFLALFLFNATLGLLHAPGIVEAMLTNELFHFAAHFLVFFTGILMWWPVLGPIPDTPRLAPFPRMGYLFLQSLVPTVPASFLTLGDDALYKIYETFPRLWGISAHTDQVLAGFIMKFGGGLLLWGAITWVFFEWWRDEQRYGAALTAPVR